MRPASAKMLMADLAHLDAELVVKPAGNQTAMAPGRIRRGSLEAQQRRDHALGKGGQLTQHPVGVEAVKLRQVQGTKLCFRC